MKKLLYIFLGLSLIFACSDDSDNDGNEPCPSEPTLQTNPATEIQYSEMIMAAATFNGEITNNPIGPNCETLSITSQGFAYANHTLPTIDDESISASGQNISASVSNLNHSETYYVRTYLTNSLGTFYGNEVSFNVPGADPVVYLAENGVTIKAADWAELGMSGEVNGITYTIVDRSTLIEQANNGGDLSKLCTSMIEDLSNIFQTDIGDYYIDVSSWDVSNVTSLQNLFKVQTAFNSDLSNWDVSNVTDMRLLFGYAYNFNSDLSNWDVSSVTDMSGMFTGAISFNQDLSGWDVSNVTDMAGMFSSSSGFNQDLSGWDVSNVADCLDFCRGTTFAWALPKPSFQNCGNQGCNDYDCEPSDGQWTVIMYDSFGDGWQLSDFGGVDGSGSLSDDDQTQGLTVTFPNGNSTNGTSFALCSYSDFNFYCSPGASVWSETINLYPSMDEPIWYFPGDYYGEIGLEIIAPNGGIAYSTLTYDGGTVVDYGYGTIEEGVLNVCWE